MSLRQRPESFRLDYGHSLARGLVFAGLGQNFGGMSYIDSNSQSRCSLYNMDINNWNWIDKIKRSAIYLNGINEYVACPKQKTYSSFSYLLWYKSSSIGNDKPIICFDSAGFDSGQDAYTGVRFDVGGAFGHGTEVIKFAFGDINYETESYVTSTQLDCLCITWNKGVYPKMFKNGKSISIPTSAVLGVVTPGATYNSDLTINIIAVGRGVKEGFFYGQISDVLVFSRVLSTGEIQQFSDPSNVMYSGLIKAPKRKLYAIRSTPMSKRYFRIGSIVTSW